MLFLQSDFGYNITSWFNQFNGSIISSILNVFDFIGSETFFILLIPLIFWCINKSVGKRVLILILLTAYINFLLKSNNLTTSSVMIVTALWLYFASLTNKKLPKILSYIIVLLYAISSLIHEVNSIGDVFVGIIATVIIFVIFRLVEPGITETANQQYTIGQRILLVCFFTVAAIVLLVFLNVEDMSEAIIYIGCFFGTSLGIILEKQYLGFSVDGSFIIRTGRYVLGLIFISIIFYGVQSLYNFIDIDSSLIIFLKYFLITFISTYPIPKLFVITNLSVTD